MKVIKATDSAVNAIRKMDSISRSLVSNPMKKQSSFIAEGGSSSYSGPFMVKWLFTNMLSISCPSEYMGGNEGYCGSICAPDMQIIRHLESNNISFTPGQENTLLTLTVIWGESGVDRHWFSFVPDPWKNCTNETKLSAVDFLNPKTEDYPHRNPYMAIYPIVRMEGNKIVQIQQGHIVDSNRWWRS